MKPSSPKRQISNPKQPNCQKLKTSDDEVSLSYNMEPPNARESSKTRSRGNSFYTEIVDNLDWNATKSSMHTSFSDDDAEDDTIIISAWKQSGFQKFMNYLLYILTFGFAWLIFYWKPKWRFNLRLINKTCLASEEPSSYLTVETCFDEIDLIEKFDSFPLNYLDPEYDMKCMSLEWREVKSFVYRDVRFHFDSEQNTYILTEPFITKKLKMDKLVPSLSKLKFADGSNPPIFPIENKLLHKIQKIPHSLRSKIYFDNAIRVKVPPHFEVFIKEILTPFYIFQVFACILWYNDEYEVYATSIVIMSLTGIIGTLYSVRKEKSKLQRMVEKSNNSLENKLIVDENSQNRLKFETVLSPDLVIGNIIQLDEKVGQTMSCDVILLTGNVLMNEGMLTGESMPITKIQASTAGENQFYNHNEHKQHTIYCGTEVLQCRQIDSEPCLGLVIRTGFWTTKGSLIRSILYPKPSNLKLQRDSIRFILSFAKLASIGFFYSLYILWKNGATLHETIMKPLDMITVIVPPALPAAVAVGVLYAQNRLKKFHEISCISPTRINVAGQVDIAAFDKTGTLTEDGLRLKSVSVVKSENNEVGENRAFSVDDEMLDTDDKILISTSKTENCSNAEENSTNLLSTPSATKQNGKNQNFTSTSSSKNNPEFTQVTNSNQISDMMHTAMAACHTLTILNGEIRGDPLDVEMFNFTNFVYNEPDQKNHDTLQVSTISHKNNPENIFGFQRQIPFTSLAQRMSVVVKSQLTNTSIIFTKGAPERIASLCKKSEIPDNYFKELSKLTSKGYRVIALAYRINKLNWRMIQKADRNKLEKNLSFLGFLLLENPLKIETKKVITQLDSAGINSVMITGDNLDTGLAVARQCRIVKETDRVFVAETRVDGNRAQLRWINTQNTQNPRNNQNTQNTHQSENGLESLFQPVLACTGSDFVIIATHFPKWLNVLAARGRVLARMKPEHKSRHIKALTEIGYTTLMCGDGSNDCAALKRAHVGVSLSELDASVASPFTSKNPNITCVEKLIREGRCSLVTTIVLFKFIALYSMIQFVSLLMIYYQTSNLSDWMFMYIDLLILDSIAVTISLNKSFKTLSKEKPPKSLMDGRIMVSMFTQVLINGVCQFVFFYFMKKTMLCYREGVILPGTEYCNCPSIINKSQIINPDFLQGVYKFPHYTEAKTDKDCEFIGEDVDCTFCGFDSETKETLNCTLRYDSFKDLTRYSEISVPVNGFDYIPENIRLDGKHGFDGKNVFNSTADWQRTCPTVFPEDFAYGEGHRGVYGVHNNFVRKFIVTGLFFYSIVQYLGMAFIYSTGPPFRTSIFKNYKFLITLLLLTALTVYILLAENPVLFHLNGNELNLHDLLEIVDIPERSVFYWLLCVVGGINICISWFCEELITNSSTNFKKLRKLTGFQFMINYFDKVDKRRDEQEHKTNNSSGGQSNKNSGQYCNLFEGIQNQLDEKARKFGTSDLERNSNTIEELDENDENFENNRVLKQHMALLDALEAQPGKLYEKYFETENYDYQPNLTHKSDQKREELEARRGGEQETDLLLELDDIILNEMPELNLEENTTTNQAEVSPAASDCTTTTPV